MLPECLRLLTANLRLKRRRVLGLWGQCWEWPVPGRATVSWDRVGHIPTLGSRPRMGGLRLEHRCGCAPCYLVTHGTHSGHLRGSRGGVGVFTGDNCGQGGSQPFPGRAKDTQGLC